MQYLALAVDYDETTAHDGVVAEATLEALRRVPQSGRRLLLVTGRELPDLIVAFPHYQIFDRIVAENGAVLCHPGVRDCRPLAPEPPPQFVAELRRRGVPISVGRAIVATSRPHEHAILAAIRDLGLEWHVIFNKGSVMALPSAVTKATGLAAALAELGLTPDRVVGIGDAENDHAFLRYCGLGVAVANALPAVKAAADLVTAAANGAGVREVIDRLLANDLAGAKPQPDHHEPATT